MPSVLDLGEVSAWDGRTQDLMNITTLGLQPRALRVDEAATNNFTLRHMEDHLGPTEMVVWQGPAVACYKGPPMNRPKMGLK